MSDEIKNEQLLSDDMWVYGYTQIDNGVIYSKDITDSEFRTYAVVRSLVNQRKAIAWPSYDTIADLCGHSKRTAIRNVKSLIEKDLIQRITRSGTSNYFMVKKLQNSSVLRNEDEITEYLEMKEIKKEDPKKPDKKPDDDQKKDTIPYKAIMDHLNQQAETKFSHKGSANQKLIKARWNEGFGLEDFKKVIDNKVSSWKDSSEMAQYLRPATLFGNKFDQYLNEKPKNGGSPGSPAPTDRKQQIMDLLEDE